MPVIKTMEAPDLTALQTSVTATYLLNALLNERGGSSHVKAGPLVHVFLFVVDKAVRTYTRGRDLLLQYAASSNQLLTLLEATGEIETCINSTKRALDLVEKLAGEKAAPSIDRGLRKALTLADHTVRPVRNAIEHMDRDIAKGGHEAHHPAILSVSHDCRVLSIGASKLSTDDLADVLEHLHSLAMLLSARDRSSDSL